MNSALPSDLDQESIVDLIDERYDLRLEKAKLNAQVKALDERANQIEGILIEYHNANPEVAQIQGNRAKVSWSVQNNYGTEAGTKEEVRDYLFQNNLQYMMTWHLNRASVDEYVSLYGALPPNVTCYEQPKVSCTKL